MLADSLADRTAMAVAEGAMLLLFWRVITEDESGLASRVEVSIKLWVELGHEAGVMNADWPVVNEEALKRDELQLAVQVNGKVRDQIKVSSSASKEEIEAIAMASEKIQTWLEGKTIRKVIVVPGRLVNIAVS